MIATAKTQKELLAENEALRLRLEEAEETLRAISGGAVDAFAVTNPDNISSVITLTDITGRKAAEMELQRSEVRLQSAYSHLQVVNEELQIASEELQVQSEELQSQNQELQELWERSRLAEASLLAIRLDLDRAQEVGSIGSWRLDVRINVLTWSDENYRIFGIPKGTPLTYETFLSTIHPDDLHYVNTRWNAGLRGEPYDIEHRLLVNNRVKWVREKAYLEFKEDGTLIGGFGITQDITDRKQAEEALKESEFFFKESQRAAFIGSYKTDFITGRWESSEILDTIFGIDSKYTRSIQGWLDLVHPEDRDMMDQYLREEVIAKRTLFSKEYRIIRKNDGETRWVHGLGEVAYDENDTLVSLTGTIQDITKRKLAEDALVLKNTELETAKKLAEDKRRWLAAVMEALPIGVAITDVMGGTVLSNKAYEQLWGESRPETRSVEDYAAYKAWWVDSGKPVEPEEWASALAVRTGETISGQVMRIQRFDDSTAFVINSASPVRDADNRIVGCAVAIQDISELKRIEESLRESEERHRVLSETMLQGVVHQDASGTIISMNPAAEQILGKSRDDFLGITSIDTEHDTIRENGEIFPGMEHPTMVALRTGLPVRNVVMGVFNPKLKEYRWIGIDAVPVFSPGENLPSEVYSVFGDITDRKNAEMALQESEQRMQQALHVSRSFTFDWQPATDQVIRSASCAAILKLTGDEAGNDTGGHYFQCVHPDDRARFVQILGDLTPASDCYTAEYRYVCKDGSEITLEETGRASFDDSGRMQRLFGVSTDITLRKNAELALKLAYDEMEMRVAERTNELANSISHLQIEIWEREFAESTLREETAVRLQAVETLREKEQMLIQQSRQAAMGEMIGNIAHQWRQPLNNLGLYIQSLGVFYGLPDFNKEFLDDYIAKSMETIQHMSKTIDDFRDYFKPEKEKADFYVIEAIKNTLSLLAGNFQNPMITIDLVEHDNPVINGYQNEFAQVFLNILNNARDAIIEREIADAKVLITISSEKNCAVVTVADNAGGIPDEVLNKVFDPYFTTKGPQLGTGIGLFMSKNIIEKNMDGRLTVHNTETGAEFRIEVEHGAQD